MSWFNRRPKIKEPERKAPRHSSPISDKRLKEAKEKTGPDNKAAQNPKE